jgi:tetratricopeptide (TPR) repeat protein
MYFKYARSFAARRFSFSAMPLAAFALCLIFFSLSTQAFASEDLLYFKKVSEPDADKFYDEALHLKKTGNIEQALEKYESAVISKRVILSQDDAGLKNLLVDKYEKLSAAGKEIENYYKLAYLYDLTGDLKKSAKLYSMALELAGTDTIRQHISSLLDGVNTDRKYYQKLNAQSARLPEPEEPSKTENSDEPKKTAGQGETADKIKESKRTGFNDRIEELNAQIASSEKKLEESQEEERKSKNDWSGRADFKRDWRDTESTDPSVDKTDPYQNTYRRRYRQAKSAREEIEKELEKLKEDRKKVEEELKEFEALNEELPSQPSENEAAEESKENDNNEIKDEAKE